MSGRAFRFEPLLNWAEQREEQQMLVLAAALQAEQAERDALDRLVAERERELARLDATPVVDPPAREAATAYLEHLERRIEEQRGAVQAATDEAARQRAALLDIEQEKQSLQRLRERDEAEAAEAEQRRETNAVDDLNMSRHARTLRPDGRGGKGVA